MCFTIVLVPVSSDKPPAGSVQFTKTGFLRARDNESPTETLVEKILIFKQ